MWNRPVPATSLTRLRHVALGAPRCRYIGEDERRSRHRDSLPLKTHGYGSTMNGCIVRRAGPIRPAVKAEIAGVTGVGSARSIPPTALFPAYFPLPASPAVLKPSPTPRQKHPSIDPAEWPTIAERARHERLRELAAEYGVSHETIRTIVRREALQRRVKAGA